MSQSTLFNYFKKVNTPDKKPEKSLNESLNESNKENLSAIKNTPKHIKSENKMDSDDDDQEAELIGSTAKRSLPLNSAKKSKRRRIMVLEDSDESTDEKPAVKEEKDIEMEVEKDDSDEDEKPIVKKKEKSVEPKSAKKEKTNCEKFEFKVTASPSVKPKTPSKKPNLEEFCANNDDDASNDLPENKYKHYSYTFLEEDKIRDSNKRLKSDPNYDPRTLYIPDDFLKNLTPALRQWWELKVNNFDVILFFKVGKFYELYHMDAVIAVKELNLTFMKGDFAHCGFPEIAYTRYADALVAKGYKVGRVEQTETPEMMNERLKASKKNSKFDKTVRREICKVTTPGTKTSDVMDNEFTSASSNYLFSIVEKVSTAQEKTVRSFGVCFIDTTVGKLYIGQFEDDRHCSKLRTVLAKYPAAHILYEKNSISKEMKLILDHQACLLEGLNSSDQIISASKLLRILLESNYFKSDNTDEFKWPETLKSLLSESDTLGLTPKPEYEQAFQAMSGILWCLKSCLIDEEILSMQNFELYVPEENKQPDEKAATSQKKRFTQKYMVLDSISLTNLEVVKNNYDNSVHGTLFEKVDYCNTPFGKRLLKSWLVNPLCDPVAINDRLDAIEDLMNLKDELAEFGTSLKSLPDLERLLSKIHNIGNVPKDHPDSRAILYENDTYSKKKVEDFTATLNGFSIAAKLFQRLSEYSENFKSKLLKSITKITKEEEKKSYGFPYLQDLLKYYNTTFDAEKAKKEGKITPTPGINKEYDTAVNDIKNVEKELNLYLSEQKKELGCTISYFGTAKNRYQLEIPETKCKHLSDDYELTSTKKGFKRYWTPEIKDYLAQLTDAEDRKEQALRNTMKCLFKNFDNHHNVWNRAVQCLGIVDVFISLCNYINNSGYNMCRPQLFDIHEHQPFIEIVNGNHPSITKTFNGDFIPNDIVIGKKDAPEKWRQNPLILVTGPNMGGKSTLMRQTGLTVILAQIGCYVPAESCKLTPVDRVFTRIGASDKILAGESTFFLELSETACILHSATKNSLVLIDELGRGTATYDGVAIAYSVIKELANNIKCLTLFSTHYHHLIEEFDQNENVSLGHMKCLVEKDANSEKELITFLYKFDEGACPKSHGFNAAHLADIPEEIIVNGSKKSEEFETFTKRVQVLKDILICKTKTEICSSLQKLSI